MNFNCQLSEKTSEVELIIKKYLPKEEGLQKTVIQAMNYSMLNGGKRLRPLLMNETYILFGGASTVVEPFMAAMEMIHSYSLVHDDLPALDNDEYRRGKKATHAQFGEAMGLLAGDALLNYAYETAVSAFDIEFSTLTAKALKILSEKAGIFGMIGGQVADVESEGKSVSPETLSFIHTKKCGALIEAAMLIGSVLAGASQKQQKAVEHIAGNIGLAFQIQDDILDVTGNFEVLGKPVGSDDKNSKTTYIKLFGLEESRKKVYDLSEEALTLFDSLPYQNSFLRSLLRSLIYREK